MSGHPADKAGTSSGLTHQSAPEWDNDMPITMTAEELVRLVFEAAGAATAPLLEDHPDYVFPSERVAAGVARVLADHGIELGRIDGYAGALGRG